MGHLCKDIEATKITSDWFLWMHHTVNEIPSESLKKYKLAEKITLKICLALIVLTNQIKYQKKINLKIMKLGKINIILIIFFLSFFSIVMQTIKSFQLQL